MQKRDNNFSCDTSHKALAAEIMKEIMNQRNVSFSYYIPANPVNNVDIYATATTTNGQEVTYSIECKHRNNYHTDYQGEWMLEVAKYDALKSDITTGKADKAIYVNTYQKDNYFQLWDVTTLVKEDNEESNPAPTILPCPKTTVGTDEGADTIVEKPSYLLNNNDVKIRATYK